MRLVEKPDGAILRVLEHPNGTRIWILYPLAFPKYFADKREALAEAVQSFSHEAATYKRRCPGLENARSALADAHQELEALEGVQGQ